MVYAAPPSDAQSRATAPRPCLDGYDGESVPDRSSGAAIEIRMDWRAEVTALAPALRAFAWSLCHNSADADDLVQETLIKAWTHRDRFEPGTNLRAWLFTILRNTYYTSVVRRRREVADEDGKHAARLTSAATQEWSLAVHALRSAMAELPDEHREALILVGAAGLTYEEAAEICGCALGTIKSRVNRARTRLLRLMNADGALDALAGDPDPGLSQGAD